MMDWSRLVAALIKAPGIVPDVVASVDAHVPDELAAEWAIIRDRVLAESDPTKAAAVIVGGLSGAFQAITAGHGEVGPSHAHMG